MSTLREAAQQALEAMESMSDCYVGDDDDSSRLQSDLENGVRWLNENAASEFNKKYPQLAGFNTWLNKRDGT